MRKITELRKEYLRAKSYNSRKLREEQGSHIRFYKSLDPFSFNRKEKGENVRKEKKRKERKRRGKKRKTEEKG